MGEETKWCRYCERETIHRVKGYSRNCLICLEMQEKQMTLPGVPPPPKEPKQQEMFSERDKG